MHCAPVLMHRIYRKSRQVPTFASKNCVQQFGSSVIFVRVRVRVRVECNFVSVRISFEWNFISPRLPLPHCLDSYNYCACVQPHVTPTGRTEADCPTHDLQNRSPKLGCCQFPSLFLFADRSNFGKVASPISEQTEMCWCFAFRDAMIHIAATQVCFDVIA